MNESLQDVCNALSEVSATILSYSADERTMTEMYGWNFPAISPVDLAGIAERLRKRIEQSPGVVDGDFEEELEKISKNLRYMKTQTIQYFFNGHGQQAVPAYLATMDWVSSVIDQQFNWQVMNDPKAMPAPIARQLRNIKDRLEEIVPQKNELEAQIKLISDARETAESLPADLRDLREARNSVEKIRTESASFSEKISVFFKDSETAYNAINEKKTEADKLVEQCGEAYRITTTKGLAASFDKRALWTTVSMWIWVVGLLTALYFGSNFGAKRIELLSEVVNKPAPEWSVIWMHIILSLLSIGAPLWFAWLSTKQINQRFRMSEDYAFKASVAKAYEGYKREAARIDKSFEARLFNSALSRLEEAPLRLVEYDVYGSPWHEFIASKPFQQALENIPDLKDKFVEIAKEGISIFKRSSNNKSMDETTED